METKKKNIVDSLKKSVKQFLPRKIAFVKAKTAIGAKTKSNEEEFYTRVNSDEQKGLDITVPKAFIEANNPNDEGETLSLFKSPSSKKQLPDSQDEKVKDKKVSRATLNSSNTARDWLNVPRKSFMNVEEDKTIKEHVLSKPLPSQEEKQPSFLQETIKPKNEIADWGIEENDYSAQIEGERHKQLLEWAEMRRPDEWDALLDQGRSKKVKKNQHSEKREGRNNPFQDAAMSKNKKKRRFSVVC